MIIYYLGTHLLSFGKYPLNHTQNLESCNRSHEIFRGLPELLRCQDGKAITCNGQTLFKPI